jgi:hypothetical protein
MRTALLSLQKAIYQALSNYQPLMSKITGVYDDVPQTLIDDTGTIRPTAFPYVTLDISSNNEFDTKSSFGENIQFTIHTWSAYPGKAETYNLTNLIYEALKSPLSLESGFSIARFVPGRPTIITDIDGKTKHGILDLQFWINN